MATEKTAVDYVNEFLNGFYDTAVKASISFGDFLARISGYRDFQVDNNSVVPGLDTHAYQQQAFNELRILYEAITHQESLSIIKNALVKDIQERPAYYIGGFATTQAIGATFSNKMVKTAYSATITGTKIEQTVHELYGSVENFLNVHDNEFYKFINSNMGTIAYSPNATGSYDANAIIKVDASTPQITISYITYSPTSTKTSTTVSAYNTTGDLIGRTTSKHASGDFIAVASLNTPASTLNSLQQTQTKNETLAQDAFAVAKFVGLDKNSATGSEWINTLNSANSALVYKPNTINYFANPEYFNTNYNTNNFYNYNYSGNGSSDLYYGDSRGYTLYAFPVILDLDGDGVELVSKEQSHAWFDTAGDGTLHKTGWVGADDGLLVIDENSEEVNCEAREATLGCGKITLKEMAFAARTTIEDTDLQALASEFDSNYDGKLDTLDTEFSKFHIWKDTNGNGETDEINTRHSVLRHGIQFSRWIPYRVRDDKIANNQDFKNTRRVA